MQRWIDALWRFMMRMQFSIGLTPRLVGLVASEPDGWKQNEMKRLMIPIFAGIAVGATWAALGPSISVGVIPYGEIALYGSWFLAGPIALVSALLLAISRGKRCLLTGIGVGISGFFLVSLFGMSHADHLKRTQNRLAKDYCESLMPKLDAYKSEHGDYPDRIDALLPDDRRSLPIYLRDASFYFKGTNGYSFGWSDSPRFPFCSGVSSYHRHSGRWDCCADWGG